MTSAKYWLHLLVVLTVFSLVVSVVLVIVMLPRCIDLTRFVTLNVVSNSCSLFSSSSFLFSVRRHKDDVLVQESGCVAIAHLAVNKNNKALIVLAGGVSVILKNMRRHSADPKLQAAGCGALWNLSPNLREAMKFGALAVVQDAVTNNPRDRTIQTYGRELLRGWEPLRGERGDRGGGDTSEITNEEVSLLSVDETLLPSWVDTLLCLHD
jgi:hypothetical protein